MRIHKIANVGKALAFIGEKGVKLAGIGAEGKRRGRGGRVGGKPSLYKLLWRENHGIARMCSLLAITTQRHSPLRALYRTINLWQHGYTHLHTWVILSSPDVYARIHVLFCLALQKLWMETWKWRWGWSGRSSCALPFRTSLLRVSWVVVRSECQLWRADAKTGKDNQGVFCSQ